MYRIMVVVGTRPEIIKLSRVINEIDAHFDLTLVHTGQNYDYELNEIFFKDLNIRQPDYYLNSTDKRTAKTIANIIDKSDAIFETIKPHGLLVYGDTNSTLCVISAKKKKIPVFHMEAGNRCFDDRVPEEINRRIVDHSSDINMTISEHARNYLIREGIRSETIFKIGSSMHEVLSFYKDKIESSSILKELELKINNYFVFSTHREENIDNPDYLSLMIDSLNHVADSYGQPCIYSVHPRLRKSIDCSDFAISRNIKLMKPLAFTDYIKLQQNSRCVISDSGTIFEEASLLSFPAVTVRNSHERPEAIDSGHVVVSDHSLASIQDSVKMAIKQRDSSRYLTIPQDYQSENVSIKVSRVIQGYISQINKKTYFSL